MKKKLIYIIYLVLAGITVQYSGLYLNSHLESIAIEINLELESEKEVSEQAETSIDISNSYNSFLMSLLNSNPLKANQIFYEPPSLALPEVPPEMI